jgi:uncharacterized protein (DUF58 family)
MTPGHALRSLLRLPDFSSRPTFDFIAKRSGPFDGDVVLDKNRVYILPTRTGLVYMLLLLLLLIGSVNYGKSLGYMLTFLLAGLGNIIMFMTWRNLAGLRLSAGGCQPVFAGDYARFAVELVNAGAQPRYSLAISQHGCEYEVVDLAADSIGLLHFRVDAKRRGLLRAGRFRLYTEFPAGLFVAWTWIELEMHCTVYPKPSMRAAMPLSQSAEDGDNALAGAGLEEYAGLRKYQTGDSLRRVSWKASARSDVMHTKEFSGGQPQLLWIDWQAQAAAGLEARLSRMARLVIDAEAGHSLYGLRLPGCEIRPDRGGRHYHRCLKALATFAMGADVAGHE